MYKEQQIKGVSKMGNEIDILREENEKLRRENKVMAKQKGVACLEHDLVHFLACGHCFEDLKEQNDVLRNDISRLEKVLHYRETLSELYSTEGVEEFLRLVKDNGHEVYMAWNFTDDEIIRNNPIAEAVLKGEVICKRCGKSGRGLIYGRCGRGERK